jgi:hypothetical protein
MIAIEADAIEGARLIPALHATKVAIRSRTNEQTVCIAIWIIASELPSPSLIGKRQ